MRRRLGRGIQNLVIVAMATVILPGICGHLETHYTRTATVVSVNHDEITVNDTTGNEWFFYGTGYKEGDTVKMKMFTSYTDSDICDDEIVNVKVID